MKSQASAVTFIVFCLPRYKRERERLLVGNVRFGEALQKAHVWESDEWLWQGVDATECRENHQSLTMGIWCLSSKCSYSLMFHKLHPSSLTHTVKVYTSLCTLSFFKRETLVAQVGLELLYPQIWSWTFDPSMLTSWITNMSHVLVSLLMVRHCDQEQLGEGKNHVHYASREQPTTEGGLGRLRSRNHGRCCLNSLLKFMLTQNFYAAQNILHRKWCHQSWHLLHQ